MSIRVCTCIHILHAQPTSIHLAEYFFLRLNISMRISTVTKTVRAQTQTTAMDRDTAETVPDSVLSLVVVLPQLMLMSMEEPKYPVYS